MLNHLTLKSPPLRILIYGPKHLWSLVTRGKFLGSLRLMVEISGKCTLQCPLCYQRKRYAGLELSAKQWEEKIVKVLKKKPEVLGVVWLGGEPMLRFNLVKKLSRYFFYNVICTNATIPLKKIRNTIYWVSIDGTKEYYEKQRGLNYEKVKKNIQDSPVDNLTLICLLSKLNKGCVKQFVTEWASVPTVGKIIFSFYTPNFDDLANNLWLSDKEKAEIIKEISLLARKYPQYLSETTRMLEAYRRRDRKSPSVVCHNSSHLFLDSTGKPVYHKHSQKKVMCGCPDADCSKCGTNYFIKVNYARQHKLGTLKQYFFSKISSVIK